jgi:acyl-CoA synthetase (NDP forming)
VADTELNAILDRGLAPRGVAVYGASARRPQSQAARIARRLLTGGYEDRVVLVNPRAQEVHGLATVEHAGDSPLAGDLDFAVISVPRDSVISAVEDCAAAGVRLAVVTSARFAEADARGAELQAELVECGHKLGVRLFGPNCMGLVNYNAGLFAADPKSATRPGSISIVSQSGLLSMRLMDFISECGQGVDLWLTMGNSADLDPPALVRYMASRPSTSVVVLYLESILDRDRLAASISEARTAGTDVVLLKAGRSEIGSRAAASHTGAMATADVFVDVLVEEVDSIRVDTVREAAQVASMIATIGRPPPPYLVAGGSGGDCVLAADACAAHGVPLAVIGRTTVERVRAIVPEAGAANPLDVSPFTWDGARQNAVIAALATDPGVGTIVLLDGWGWDVREEPDGSRRLELDDLASAAGGTVVPIINDSRMTEWQRHALVGNGIAVTSDGETIWRSLAHIARGAAPHGSGGTPVVILEPMSHATDRYLGELEAFGRLRNAGVPMVVTTVVSTADELAEVCQGLGYPVVVKGLVPGVIHKAARNLVRTEVFSEPEARHAWQELHDLVAAERGQVVVQPQVRAAIGELIVGTRDDPVFGLHLMIGRGGSGVEAMSDVVWARAPVSPERAAELLLRTRIGQSLQRRCNSAVATSELPEVVSAVSRLAQEWGDTIAEIEINPLIVRTDDLVAVDAVLRLR